MAERDLTENPVRELVRRFLITILLGVVVYRFGIFVPIPYVDVEMLFARVRGGGADGNDPLSAILQYADMFNGGAIANASVFGLGIMPYISASIIFQLLTFSLPALKQLQKEGEGGRRKINQYTRYATVLICVVQASIAAVALHQAPPENVEGMQRSLVSGIGLLPFVLQSVLVITTGSMVLLWLSEQITKYGIGNGVSVIIMIGILAAIPGAMRGSEHDLGDYLLITLVCVAIIAAIVVVVLATRRIQLEQQRRVQGNRSFGGASTTLPLKLNQANVIPVIFASPVIMVLAVLAEKARLGDLFAWGSVGHRYAFAALIIGFTYFYISVTFDLKDMAQHFKQAGFFVRGIKPGKNTVDFLSYHLTRITFVGAVFLAAIAIMPELLGKILGFGQDVGSRMLMGGTGLLIVVGVALDIIQKIASFFLAHQFRGLGSDEGIGGSPKKTGKRF